jgi:undecaprenyl-diphosphatase
MGRPPPAATLERLPTPKVISAVHAVAAATLLAAAHPSVPSHLTWLQSIVVGFVQGVTELFPVSSLGHSVLVPELFGWHDLVRGQDSSDSFWLAFIVALHVANAAALLLFFWRDWVRVIRGFFSSLVKRKAETSGERLAWLIIVGTIPVGIIGLLLQHAITHLLAKPMSAAIFLAVNGVILLAGQRLRSRPAAAGAAAGSADSGAGAHRPAHRAAGRTAGLHSKAAITDDADIPASLARLPYRDAGIIGIVQCLALIAGISRDGVTMVAGLLRGLDNDDAAKFAFLLSTPVILAAGVLKVHDLTGPLGNGVRPQILGGAAVTFVVSLVAVRFLSGYFKERNLTPFGIYCLAFGVFMIAFVAAGA